MVSKVGEERIQTYSLEKEIEGAGLLRATIVVSDKPHSVYAKLNSKPHRVMRSQKAEFGRPIVYDLPANSGTIYTLESECRTTRDGFSYEGIESIRGKFYATVELPEGFFADMDNSFVRYLPQMGAPVREVRADSKQFQECMDEISSALENIAKEY